MLAAIASRVRRRLAWRGLALAAGASALAIGFARLGGVEGPALIRTALVILALTTLTALVVARTRRPSDAAIAEHLNRHLPALQESSQLLLSDPGELAATRRLQRDRVSAALEPAAADSRDWLPRAWPRAATWLLLSGLALVIAAPCLQPLLDRGEDSTAGHKGEPGEGAPAVSEARLVAADVQVTPPRYTGIETFGSGTLDVTLPENSEMAWRLDFSQAGQYALKFGDETLPLAPDDGQYTATRTVARTGLYRVIEVTEDGERALPGIYTLSVTLDRAPDVRIVEPDGPTLEVPMDGPAQFMSRVLARDDHGIATVEIRASVAKGAGEGVKFRDEVFTFDQRTSTPEGERLVRNWRLADLGMEPGDEVYFFVVATDQRAPEPNTGRSDTVIVRWLDEAPEGVAAEGFAIDLMPDYFKSQRQIIIETEQLIADRNVLGAEEFDQASRGLGQAQSDLKQRYGQYLGDEFGEGDSFDRGADFDVTEGLESEEDRRADADHHDDHAHAGHAEPGHGPLESGGPPAGVDLSGGADDLVARFGHAHGEAEIGPITSRNPVGMMKRSIANMWQAELHLLLSEPEEALPFEYEALEYLNLARQAERVYTRRLGFEPPPVSEERRLEGELDEILEYERRLEPPPPEGDVQLFSEALDWLSRTDPATALASADLDRLGRVRDRLSALAQQRPALIRHAATVEKWRVAGQLALPDCADCLDGVRQALWTLLPAPAAEPSPGQRSWSPRDPVVRDYSGMADPEGPSP